MNSRQWWTIAGLMSLAIAIGCSHEQVAKATAEATPTNVPQVAQVPVTVSDKPFVPNENLQTVYFDLSQSKLDDKAMDQLKKNAEWLQKNTPFMIQLASYTDSRGSTKKNMILAERRATQVRNTYIALGIPKNRMIVKAMGEEGPACTEMTEECLSQSRRTETLIENKTVALK